MSTAWRARSSWRASVVAITLVAASITFAAPASAVTVTAGSGNPSCADLIPGSTEVKIDRAPVTGDQAGPVTITSVYGNSFDFTSTDLVVGVIVKGGTNSAYNFYDYRPGGTFGDTGLTTAFGQGISHVSFCYLPFTPTGTLDVSKTAAGSYDRTVSWTLDKSVTPAAHEGVPGQQFSSDWTIVADVTDSGPTDHAVSGVISIVNTTNMTATVSVADVLDDGTVAAVDCDPVTAGNQTVATLAPGEDVDCAYLASPSDASATLNTATVTTTATVPAGYTAYSGFGTNGVTTATAAVSFTENLTGDPEGVLSDDRAPGLPQTISSDTTVTYPETFTCPTDPNVYTDGLYTEVFSNTAVLELSTGNLDDTASVTLTCRLAALQVSKTAEGDYDHVIDWDIDKTALPTSHTGLAGDTFSQDWLIDVTKTTTDTNHTVSGTVTITNPSSIAQTFTASDLIDGTTAVTLTCPSMTVAAGATVVCTYSTALAGAQQNVVTVTAPGNDPVSASADITYTETVVGDEQVTLTDDRFPAYSRVFTDSGTQTLTETLACPTDASAYTDRMWMQTIINTGTITGPVTLESDSASTVVTCTYPWVGETATGAGIDFLKNSNWFMFTPLADLQAGTVDLIAGQHYDAGDITLVGDQLTITLHDGYRFADVANNVKINPLSSCSATQQYVSPGRYQLKTTATGSSVTLTVPLDGCALAIHVDVERWVG